MIEPAGTIAALKVDCSAEGPVPQQEHAFLSAPHADIARKASVEAGVPRIRQTAAHRQIIEQESRGRLSLLTTGSKQRQEQQRRKQRTLPT